jgi:uncharacterized OB-fold protein
MVQTTFIPQGWECPKCKRVYSPTTSMCSHCPQNSQGVTTTGTSLTFSSGTTHSIHSFSSNKPNPTAKTKCILCGKEKWEHPEITYT